MEKNKLPQNKTDADEKVNEVSPREQNQLMFAFDDQSPQTTPREGSQQTAISPQKLTENKQSLRNGASEAEAQESPSDSPRPKKMFIGPQDFLTQSKCLLLVFIHLPFLS